VRQFSVGKQAKQRQKYVYQRDVRILENWRRENLDNFANSVAGVQKLHKGLAVL
jgi:hypothetical protein